ncbi:hypothetical protein HG263_05125 [Pseudoalteromonas sp. JBTF-M23]|uniref:Uncharacterized protein n=1 Tax=Pseudoalteromonas caenipelagi TaxID=2726988 RepID=A0A849VAN7_9GAMM|nr:hypothetical protein [Pseudoalteromonas caenipelagi]NOU49918.1 hypothetical protein [Pseudoalteromonas caenipelagi]
MKNIFLCCSITLFINGCMFVTKDVRYFDKECQVYATKTVLDVEMIKAANQHSRKCTETCPALTDNNVYFGAASLLVASAAAVSKNNQHWQQRKLDCRLQEASKQQLIVQDKAKSDISDIERQY